MTKMLVGLIGGWVSSASLFYVKDNSTSDLVKEIDKNINKLSSDIKVTQSLTDSVHKTMFYLQTGASGSMPLVLVGVSIVGCLAFIGVTSNMTGVASVEDKVVHLANNLPKLFEDHQNIICNNLEQNQTQILEEFRRQSDTNITHYSQLTAKVNSVTFELQEYMQDQTVRAVGARHQNIPPVEISTDIRTHRYPFINNPDQNDRY